MENTKEKKVSVAMAAVAMIALALVLIGGFIVLQISTHVVFLLAILAMGIIALISGFTKEDLQDFFIEGCKNAVLVALILMTVGTVIGSWIVSGIVPTIIYYGLEILSPKVFLVVGFFYLLYHFLLCRQLLFSHCDSGGRFYGNRSGAAY